MRARSLWLVAGAMVLTSACVDEPATGARQAPLRGGGATAIAWNHIAWNHIAWNHIAWNHIAWNELTDAQRAWQELRVDGLPGSSLPAAAASELGRDALVDPEVRELFGYIVECALGPSTSFSATDAGGATWSYGGVYGLTPSWGTGACDQQCQRSVTACLLSRVNYFGERNVLSWRRGSGIPYNTDTATMEWPSSAERSAFDLDEGAAWGNLFLMDPEVNVCSGQDGLIEASLLDTIAIGIYTGNVPIAALRMCNGDAGCLADVYAGPCGGTGRVCQTKRVNGAYEDCQRPGATTAPYDEVITIRRADFGIHADFVVGHALEPAMSSCGADVQDTRPACADSHDATCVDLALGTCALHDVRRTGLALARHASTCTAYVCAVDSLCCTLLWDSTCVSEASSMCR